MAKQRRGDAARGIVVEAVVKPVLGSAVSSMAIAAGAVIKLAQDHAIEPIATYPVQFAIAFALALSLGLTMGLAINARMAIRTYDRATADALAMSRAAMEAAPYWVKVMTRAMLDKGAVYCRTSEWESRGSVGHLPKIKAVPISKGRVRLTLAEGARCMVEQSEGLLGCVSAEDVERHAITDGDNLPSREARPGELSWWWYAEGHPEATKQ